MVYNRQDTKEVVTRKNRVNPANRYTDISNNQTEVLSILHYTQYYEITFVYYCVSLVPGTFIMGQYSVTE